MRSMLAPPSGLGSGRPRSVPPSARQRPHTTRIITHPGTPTQHRRRATTTQPHPTIPEGAAGIRTGAITTPAEPRISDSDMTSPAGDGGAFSLAWGKAFFYAEFEGLSIVN